MDDLQEQTQDLIEGYSAGRIERHEFLKWAAILGLSAPLLRVPAAYAETRPASHPIKRGGTLRLGTTVPTTTEPPLLNDSAGTAVVQVACEYLVKVDKNLIARPWLATSWTPSEGGKTWTFKLRRGVKFHNGKTMTADDVVATFKRLVDPKGASTAQSSFKGLSPAGVRKVDNYTVAFHLQSAIVDFPLFTSVYQAVILPAEYNGHFAKQPVGTGAFILKEYVPQQRARYVKNPNYWAQGLPYLDGVEVLLGLSPESQVTELAGNNIDVSVLTQANTVPALQGNPDIKVLKANTSGHFGIYPHCDKGVFADKWVRQAMALCMNRKGVIASVAQGVGIIGNDHVISPAYPYYNAIPQRPQDIAKAKKLLAAAGHPNGLSASITTASDYPDLPNVAIAAQAQMKAAGINLAIKNEPSSKYFNTTDWLDLPLTITNWAHRPTASQFFDTAYHTGAVWNASKWSNKQFDSLSARFDATLDLQQRKLLAKQIEVLMNEEVPVILPYFSQAPRAMRSNVQGVEADPATYIDLRQASLS